MKELILKIVPNMVLTFYRKIKHSKFRNKVFGKTVSKTFTDIYKTNHWASNKSISGTGSELEQTKEIIKPISDLLRKLDVKTVLDLPCGDFNWMQKVNLSSIKYIGADIVEDLVIENRKKYAIENEVDFIKINLLCDHLPVSDIIINRDCLVHLSFADIYDSIKNIKSSNCKYLLSTTFSNHSTNIDIITGNWRALNLEKPPFNFPKPIFLINENCMEGDVTFMDKSLGLWLIEDIKLPEATQSL